MILLDTNVLPRTGSLRNALMSSTLRVAAHRGLRIGISDVVLEESVNARGEAVSEATQKLQEALSQASKLMQLESIYIPDQRDVMDEWRRELVGAFDVFVTSGDHAREALRREAAREVPARLGKGARDTAIWLGVIKCAQENGCEVHFVSNNREDFADPADGGALHPRLAAECDSASVKVIYHRNLDSLISSFASRSDFEPTVELLSGEDVESLLVERLLGSEEFRDQLIAIEGSGSQFFHVKTSQVRRTKSYAVDAEILSLVDIQLALTVTTAGIPAASSVFRVPVKAWTVCSESGGLVDLSLESVGDAQPEAQE
ncbi:PIN domain-containing protein [Streptomyces sp. XY593]|uniref:PIN domain-containing protein n=1 Tax=Streptomyces sp. XY593 TaxID=1519483 RepID=UPI00099C9A4F|nr:PIN domain-containing protein [Streptomyces sp. XY593]